MQWFSFNRNTIPEKYEAYAAAVRDKNLKKQPLEEARFVVLDTETTGLNPKTDRILSIGAVAVQGHRILANDSFECFVKQDFENNDAIAVHEITPGEAAKANVPLEVMDKFINYVQGAVIIGHYVEFDFKILSESCKRNFGFGLENKYYDTMNLLKRTDNHFAQPNLNKPEDWGLDKVCERFNLPLNDRHTAMGDAMATALLFIRQLKKLQHRGVKTVGDLLAR